MASMNKVFNHINHMSHREINHRFQFLGEGISRRVYALNDKFVFKIAKGEEGLYQNRVEFHVYQHAGAKFRKYLCPIVWYRPRIIVMPRAIPLESIIKSKYVDIRTLRPEAEAYDDLRYLARRFLLFYEDIEAANSWGIVNRMPVLIDYGCTSEKGDVYYSNLFDM